MTATRRDAALAEFRLLETPGHLLRRGNQRSDEIFTGLVGRDGPRRQQFALMITVYQNPGATQGQIAALSGIDRVTLTEMLPRLIAKRWIERRRAKHDSRAWDLSLTEAGIALLRQVTPRVREAQMKLLDPLPLAERAEFLRALQRLAIAEAGMGK